MYFTSIYWCFLRTCIKFHTIETSWVHADQFTELNHLEYRFLTSLNWLAPKDVVQRQNGRRNVAYKVVIKNLIYCSLLQYAVMARLARHWTHNRESRVWIPWGTDFFFFFFLLAKFRWNNTAYKGLIESSWVHVPHFIELKVFDYKYYSWVNWTILNTYKSLRYIDAFWKNVVYFTILNLLKYMYLTSMH